MNVLNGSRFTGTGLCLAHLTVQELAPPEVVAVAAQAGYAMVSLRLLPASDAERPFPMLGGAPMFRETLARLKDVPVRVHDIEIVRLSAEQNVAELEPVFEAAAALGATRVLAAGDAADEAVVADRLAQAAALAAPFGLDIGLEFMPWRGVNTLASARRVLALTGVGQVVVDAIHLDRSGGTAQALQALPATEWGFFQICDAPARQPDTPEELLYQARSARLMPGYGGLDLVGMLRAMPEGTPVSVEVPLAGVLGQLSPLERAQRLRAATEAVLERAHG